MYLRNLSTPSSVTCSDGLITTICGNADLRQIHVYLRFRRPWKERSAGGRYTARPTLSTYPYGSYGTVLVRTEGERGREREGERGREEGARASRSPFPGVAYLSSISTHRASFRHLGSHA